MIPDQSPFKRALTVGQCIHYALSRPAVASVLLGCATGAQVEDACNSLNLSDEEKDYSDVLEGNIGSMQGACVYCSHCQPCPVQIDIASVHRYLDIALLDQDNVPPSIRQHYATLDARGADCIACGNCEARCPFDVEIIENMAKAAEGCGS